MAEKSIFYYIDGAGDDGHLGLQLPLQWFNHCLTEGGKREKVKSLLTSIFHDWHPFIGLLDRRPKRMKDLEADFKVEGESVIFRVNLCKLLWLPGENPKTELADMRKLLEAMKPFFEEAVGHNARISVHNNRDGHGRVYGKFFIGAKAANVVDAVKHLKALEDLVEASPALQHFLRSVALDLGKLGPWSWTNFSEEMLWGEFAGPTHTAMEERIRAKYEADKAAKAAT